MSLAEVAKLAGVSTSTVCRVLRNSTTVRPETTAQVAKAIKQIGFVRSNMRLNASTRLRSKSNSPGRCFAIVTVGQTIRQGFQFPVLTSFVAAVTELARQQGLSILLDELPQIGGKSRLMQSGEIGGAILLVNSQLAMDPSLASKVRELSETMPLVWALGSHSGPLLVDRIAVDSQGIGQMAASYLARQGCNRLAMVVDSPRSASVRTCAAAFVHTAHDQGKESVLFIVSDDRRESHVFGGHVVVTPNIHECVASMSSHDVRADGIFGLTNELTVRLYPQLVSAGLAPGRDVCFVSCDNDSSHIADILPKPTVIEVNTAEAAGRTLRRLLGRIDNPTENPMLIQVPPTLTKSAKMERMVAP